MTGEERRFLHLARERLQLAGYDERTCHLWWPRRTLYIRRRGRRIRTVQPLFPGYCFVDTEELGSDVFRVLRGVTGLVRFLPANDNIKPLEGEDRDLMRHLLSFGEVLRESKVTFDVNNRIVVKEGPLTGLEGRIVKVDRRKGRAKVRLDVYDDAFLIDFAFQTMEAAPTVPRGKSGDREDAHAGVSSQPPT